jgi:four helix bundle protein
MVQHNFRNLSVWQKTRGFVKEIYSITQRFPSEEKFGIVSQLRRAAISISLNIAEGSGRSTDKDFKNFLHNAYGSALEVETLLVLCFDLELISEAEQNGLVGQVDEIQRMLNAFIKKLSANEF